MTSHEHELLALGDAALFHVGACHIFAILLAETLQDEGYGLKRVEVIGSDAIGNEIHKPAHHVVAVKEEYFIDASGIVQEADYLARVEPRFRETSGLRNPVLSEIRTHEVTREQLLEPHHQELTADALNALARRTASQVQLEGQPDALGSASNYVSLNQWNLLVGPEFVSRAQDLAERLINGCPAMYRVSALKVR